MSVKIKTDNRQPTLSPLSGEQEGGLPPEFTTYTSQLFGDVRWRRYLDAFNEPTPVSIRVNPFKACGLSHLPIKREVPWCQDAFYLKERPNFTHDPLLHAGAYYVQEASSMFLDHALRHSALLTPHSSLLTALDLCAAPGGKSTLLRAALPDHVRLMSNEPDRRRANILMENMQKQGHPNVIVTNNYPKDYAKAGLRFGLILADVPCSGEGMFRKDAGAIGEWSVQNVMKCAVLQRDIISDIWPCLNPGGILVYSTCTFNTHENEENVRWITEELGGETLPIPTEPEWNITGSLLDGWHGNAYRFIPGTTRGEGLFMAVIRKTATEGALNSSLLTIPSSLSTRKGQSPLRVLSDGNPVGTQKGKSIIPAHAEALLTNLPQEKYPRAELSHDDALRYLHHEAITLPADTPRGFVIVTYQSLPLGFVKNIGNRANNLYPQEWKIRNL